MREGALHEIEAAVNLLRRQPARSWTMYLLGTVPFVLLVLTFARDMLSGVAADQCLAESFACVLVFFWMSFWKARFAGGLLADLGVREESTQRSKALRCGYVQGVLQALKLLALPFAVIAIVPLPWISALFRNVSAEANRADVTLASALRRSAKQASTAPARNWLGLLLCCTAASVVFMNVFVLLLAAPQFWKAFTGWETQWTRNAGRLVNANTVEVAAAITWLAVDPVLQAYSAVRSFHLQARIDGRDLLVRLRRLAGIGLLMMLAITAGRAAAAPVRPTTHGLSETEMKFAVSQVVQQKEFHWLRRSAQPPQEENDIGARLLHDLHRLATRVESWLESFAKWLGSLFHSGEDKSVSPGKRKGSIPHTIWFLCGIGMVLAVTIVLLIRTWLASSRSAAAGGADLKQPTERTDAGDGNILPTDRTDEQWLTLARNYRKQGDWRLAIRAMYLSNLAYLGAAQVLAIAKGKSNAMYEKELRMRCRTAGVCDAFSRANRSYERAWYGMYEVNAVLAENFEQEVEAVRGGA